MDNLMIPSITKPPLIIPLKRNNFSDFIPKTNKTILNTADGDLNHLSRTGRLVEAIKALESISQTRYEVTPNTYINLIQSCIDSNSIHLGRILHSKIGLVKETNPFVETKLVSMYAKAGCFDEARKLFDAMREKNLYTWSAMIGACAREQRWKELVKLFRSMMEDGILPDDFLFPKILQACGNCGDVETGKLIHSLAVKLGMVCYPRLSNSILAVYAKCGELSWAKRFFENMDEKDIVAWNALISGYCQKGENEKAYKLVDEMWKEGVEPGLVTWNILMGGYNQSGQCEVAVQIMKKMEGLGISADVFTWTSMISGLTQNGRRGQALDFFSDMLLAGVIPNGVTITSAISACASSKALNIGLEIHSIAVKLSLTNDVIVGNSLIDFYSKCGGVEDARRVFDLIKHKDVCTWNSMITGYCQAGYCGKAYELFMKMKDSKNVTPNVITWNAMLSGYIQNGDEDEAMDLFQRMEKEGKVKQDTASWNSLISGYLLNGEKDKAFRVFRHMQWFGVRPNPITILSILPACANILATKKVKEIHGCVFRRNFESVLSVTNSLIDTYAKSGNIEDSQTIFEGMRVKDIITWNSMIGGYVLHGCFASALDLYDQMKTFGLKANRGTFVSVLLACSHARMVDEGKKLFSSITNEYHIVPAVEHYSAMIGLYGRAGRVRKAMQFIEDMPIEPDITIWDALLTASRFHGNVGFVMHAVEKMLELDPANIELQQLMFQAYGLSGFSEDSLKATKFEKENSISKPLGQSWIEFKRMVHTFVTGDGSKLNSDLLHTWVKNVAREATKEVYFAELNIDEEEKEEISGVHSEKLALAFALIDSSHTPQTVRIVKNMRTCGDCHRTFKFVSMRYGCDIYLSDTKCLHHFKNGHCSCGDYW